jgi:hypothetical protein
MSTTFGVIIKNGALLDLPSQEDGLILPDTLNDDDFVEIIKVAFRSSYIVWTNPLAKFLPNNTKVYPLDNSHQGIYTIADIKKQIN